MTFDFISFAHQLADISGAVIRPYFRSGLNIDAKHDSSPVTQADREAELAMREHIKKHLPHHGIRGEEFGQENPQAEYQWVLDPIDGTISFMIGRPIFGTLISLVHNSIPILGVIDQPITGERWIGGSNHPTTLNDKPVKVKPCNSLSNAILATTSPDLFGDAERWLFEQAKSKAKYLAYGGDCYSYALVASGSIDAVIESGLKPHDFCALAPIIQAAGGYITDWHGRAITAQSDGRVIATGDKTLHQEIIALYAAV